MNGINEYFKLRGKQVNKRQLAKLKRLIENDAKDMATKTGQHIVKHLEYLIKYPGKIGELFIPNHIKFRPKEVYPNIQLSEVGNCDTDLIRLENIIQTKRRQIQALNSDIRVLRDGQQGIYITKGVKFK